MINSEDSGFRRRKVSLYQRVQYNSTLLSREIVARSGYLVNTIGARGGAVNSNITKIRSGWTSSEI